MRDGVRVLPLVPLVALALMTAAPGSALADEQTASSGEVSAVLSYTPTENFYDFEDVVLEIFHSGALAYRHDFKSMCNGCALAPAGYGDATALRVVNLDSDAEPEVLTDFYTGGAHCCSYTEAFDRSGDTYERARHNWLDSGYRLRDRNGDGVPEFHSADARFAYAYDCFACSRFPVKVHRFAAGRFADVTGKFPGLVKKDIGQLGRDYRSARGKRNVRAILAALVADRCSLGQCRKGFALLKRALRRGYLDRQKKFDYGAPYGRKYIRSLKRLLQKLDYR